MGGILGALLVGVIFGTVIRVEADWSPWYCQDDVSGVVYGDSLNGRQCTAVEEGTGAWRWNVWADTAMGPYSEYLIYTSTQGSDRCAGGSWLVIMSAYGYSPYWATYGNTPIAGGAFQNCTSGHEYRVAGYHLAEYLPGWQWLGFYGTTYW